DDVEAAEIRDETWRQQPAVDVKSAFACPYCPRLIGLDAYDRRSAVRDDVEGDRTSSAPDVQDSRTWRNHLRHYPNNLIGLVRLTIVSQRINFTGDEAPRGIVWPACLRSVE